MSPRQRKIFYRDRSVGFLGSFLFHALLLAAGGMFFAKPIQYAVEAGSGGLEVSLIAAPAELVAEEAMSAPLPEAVADPLISEPESVPLPAPKKMEEQKPQLIQTQPDGKDKTTFYSSGGALTEAKPNYLKNPAPPYPRAARDNGWEGLVVLQVSVDRFGRPKNVEIEATSGHNVLDESALKTVRTWKFRPAQLGALPVDSTVKVPIRFRLEDS